MTEHSHTNMTHLRAFGIHLGISLLIFVVLAYLIVFVWYPGIFFDTDGGWRGMRIIIGVDLVLGPMLTLVVFKAGKPGLKFDLAAIALLQTVCLTAGTYIVWAERPLAVVYVDSRFEVMTTDDYAHLQPPPDLDQFPGPYPKRLMVKFPEGLEEATAARQALFAGEHSPATYVAGYVPFDHTDPIFTEDPRDIELIRTRDAGDDALGEWVQTHGGSLEDYRFYTFSTRYVYRYVGYRIGEGEMTGFLNVQPR